MKEELAEAEKASQQAKEDREAAVKREKNRLAVQKHREQVKPPICQSLLSVLCCILVRFTVFYIQNAHA